MGWRLRVYGAYHLAVVVVCKICKICKTTNVPDPASPETDGISILGQEGKGNCAVVIRMRHDFAHSALPFPDGQYLDPKSPGVQRENWSVITAAMNTLQTNCVVGQKTDG